MLAIGFIFATYSGPIWAAESGTDAEREASDYDGEQSSRGPDPQEADSSKSAGSPMLPAVQESSPRAHKDEFGKAAELKRSEGLSAARNPTAQSSVVSPSMATEPAASAPIPTGPPALAWYGVTLYGTIDVGVAHLSHGAPLSQTYGPGLPYIVQAFSNPSTTSISSNGLSQSKIGLSAIEPLRVLDLNAVFKIETGFQPTSGRLTDGPKSLVENNGVANTSKVTAGDSSRAGQVFQSAAYIGLSSGGLGTVTFGRQNSLMADQLLKYDPQLQSQAFSPIGFSGISGGMGDTEDKILDNSLKYTLTVGPAHLGGLYQFRNDGRSQGGAESVDVGVDWEGVSVDFLWGRVHGAIAATSLSAKQNATAPGTLAATASDNTAYAFLGRYAIGPLKVYAGYEHVSYANPDDPLPDGTVTLGGYVLSTVNNTAFGVHKVLNYLWGGARFSVTPSFDVSGAYYHFRQNSYNANGCSDDSASSCSGSYQVGSLVADYKLSLRFDVYAGISYSRAANGMAAGFLQDDNWTSMTGVRFVF